MTTPQAAPRPDAWAAAERHIIERIGALTMWEAERWAASYEQQTARISLLANRVSFLEAAGGSAECDYLTEAFARIDDAIGELGWMTPAGARFDQAVAETLGAVAAVARYALTTVVLADDQATAAPASANAPSTTHTGR